jgi:hypothetical protein
MVKAEIWLRGMLAAVISGGANGVITGFAAIGIDPGHFNLASGFGHTLSLAGVSAVMSAIIGVAAYLKQSPLPRDSGSSDSDGDGWQHPGGSAAGAGDDRGAYSDNRGGQIDGPRDRPDEHAGNRPDDHLGGPGRPTLGVAHDADHSRSGRE